MPFPLCGRLIITSVPYGDEAGVVRSVLLPSLAIRYHLMMKNNAKIRNHRPSAPPYRGGRGAEGT